MKEIEQPNSQEDISKKSSGIPLPPGVIAIEGSPIYKSEKPQERISKEQVLTQENELMRAELLEKDNQIFILAMYRRLKERYDQFSARVMQAKNNSITKGATALESSLAPMGNNTEANQKANMDRFIAKLEEEYKSSNEPNRSEVILKKFKEFLSYVSKEDSKEHVGKLKEGMEYFNESTRAEHLQVEFRRLIAALDGYCREIESGQTSSSILPAAVAKKMFMRMEEEAHLDLLEAELEGRYEEN